MLCIKTEVLKSFFYLIDKKIISPHIERCIGKCPGLCTIFFKTSTWLQMFTCTYLVFWDTISFPFLFPNYAHGA